MRKLFLLGFVVARLILEAEANEYLEFNVTDLDRIEELEYNYSKFSSNFNPLMVGLTLIRGAGSKGAGTYSLSFLLLTKIGFLFVYDNINVTYVF